MKDKLRIGLVVAGCAPIPDVLGGGAERLITILVEENEIYGRVRFYVYCLADKTAEEKAKSYKNAQIYYFTQGNVLDKIRNIFVRSVNHLSGKTRLLKYGYYRNIVRLAASHNLDFIIDENSYLPEFAYFTRLYGKDKISTHIHSKVCPTKKKIDGLYGSIIGVSGYTVRNWMVHSEDKDIVSRVVYSAVDEAHFKRIVSEKEKEELRRLLGFKKDDFIVLYCGRLHEQKGIGKLIDSISYLPDPHIRFLIVGGENTCKEKMGEYQKSIVKRASQYGEKLVFTGYIDNSELYRYYAVAQIQMIPSICEEAAGLISIEGMSAGLPIIASVSGGLPEYVNAECAIFVERDNNMPINLARAVMKLYMDQGLRHSMSKAARKQSMRFTKAGYYNDFIDAIIDIMKEKMLLDADG